MSRRRSSRSGRHTLQWRVAILLLTTPGLTPREVADRLGDPRPTVGMSLARLAEAGVLVRVRAGRHWRYSAPPAFSQQSAPNRVSLNGSPTT